MPIDKRDVWGYSDADYERGRQAMRNVLDSMHGKRASNSIDLLYGKAPLRSYAEAKADRAKRRARLSPAMAATLQRIHERGENSCDIDDQEQGLHAAHLLAKFDEGQTEENAGMDINQVYHGQHLKAEEMQGRDACLTIQNVSVAQFDEGNKLVLGFHNTDRTLVLNKTNARMIAEMYGTETNGWIGKQITFGPDKVEFQGRIVDAIRVRYVAAQQPAQPATATNGPLPDPGATLPTDDVTRAYRPEDLQRVANVQPASNLPGADHPNAPAQPDQSGRPVGGMGAAIDDEIPF